MSRYMLNKFMRDVEMSDRNLSRYTADPSAYVEEWMARADQPDSAADLRELSKPERDALARRDYASLYQMGAHPYLLWHFTEAVFGGDQIAWRDLVEQYRAAVTPHGNVDYID